MARVTMPLLFQEFTDGDRYATVPGRTLAEVLHELDKIYPGLQAWMINAGRLTPIIKVTIDGKLAIGLDSPVRPESEICLLPSMGGG